MFPAACTLYSFCIVFLLVATIRGKVVFKGKTKIDNAVRSLAAFAMLVMLDWQSARIWNQNYWIHDIKSGDVISIDTGNIPVDFLGGSPFNTNFYFPMDNDLNYPKVTVSSIRTGCRDGKAVGQDFELDYIQSSGKKFSLTLVGQSSQGSRRYLMSASGDGFGCVTGVLIDDASLALFKMQAKTSNRAVRRQLAEQSAMAREEARHDADKTSAAAVAAIDREAASAHAVTTH